MSVSELAKPFSMSLPAIMKHLDVLSDAGLVGREKNGRIVSCRLRAEPMRDAMDWLNRYQRFWSEQLDRLAAFVEEEDKWPPITPPQPSLTIKRRLNAPPAKVYAAWTDPEKLALDGPARSARCCRDRRAVGGRLPHRHADVQTASSMTSAASTAR